MLPFAPAAVVTPRRSYRPRGAPPSSVQRRAWPEGVGQRQPFFVSVRAVILELGRSGIAPIEHVKVLDKGSAANRKLHGLDLNGKRADQDQPAPAKCGHAGEA
jgi:hypothetical protein